MLLDDALTKIVYKDGSRGCKADKRPGRARLPLPPWITGYPTI